MKGSRKSPEARAKVFMGPGKFWKPFVAFLCLLLVVGAATALADEMPASSELSLGLLQEAIDSSDAVEPSLTDPEAAEQLPHEDLGREEAVALTETVFEPVLQSTAGPLQDLEVQRYLSDTAAIIAADSQSESLMTVGGGGGEATGNREENVLLESTIPLRTESPEGGMEPVDLELEGVKNYLEPKAPLVDVGLPRELGEGIEFRQTGIRIELAGAPSDRAPSLINASVAAYPNVATDTDFSAAPTPTGIETLMTLRSPDSPNSQTLRLDLPTGTSLHQDKGGAKVVRDGKAILTILPPSAIDANGNNVPVTLTVLGDSLILNASPEEGTAYPILVDPIFESYDWYDFVSYDGQDTWNWKSNVSGYVGIRWEKGLAIQAKGGYYNPGDQSGFYYYVPRLKEEEALGRTPSSYIARMTLMHVSFSTEWGGPYSPYMTMGILGSGHWAGLPGHEAVWGYGGNAANIFDPGYEIKFENGEPGKRDQTAKVGLGLALASVEGAAPPIGRYGKLGGAAVEVADEVNPSAANGIISGWVNQTATAPITADAEDSGLGVKYVGFEIPGQGVKVASNPCLGTVLKPCPRSWKASMAANQYNPAQMPQGLDYVPITVEDVVGNKATPEATKALVRVDHTAPSLGLSGTITEQATLGTSTPLYVLKYAAADGDSVAASALGVFGAAGTGEGKLERPIGVAIDPANNIFVLDRTNNRIEKFSASGSFLSQFGTSGSGKGMLSEPSGIAIDSQQSIWIADTKNNRIVRFNEKGEFVAMYGKDVNKTQVDAAGSEAVRRVCTAVSGNTCGAGVAGSANGQFNQPRGIGMTAGGNLLIADTGNNRIQVLSPQGEYLAKFGSYGSEPGQLNSPNGVAVAPDGSVWVADTGNNRIQKWTGTFEYLFQVGSSGEGNGQFKAPGAITVSPSGHAIVSEIYGGRVQVFQSNGTYLKTLGSSGTGSSQFQEPRGLALDSGGNLVVADSVNHRVSRWSHPDYDPQSGMAKLSIKVDGHLKTTPYNTACASNSCQTGGAWVYTANEYTSGQHKVEVVAEDGVKLSTPKSIIINSINDTTPPQIVANSAFFTAPEGWVEQKNYAYSASAKDVGGSGVKSLTLFIDGQQVKNVSQACLNGGCEASLAGSINVSTYDGGAHSAELVAKDASGRITKKTWTMNVDPSGTVAVEEATDTLEALEETNPEALPVAPVTEVLPQGEIEQGNAPRLEADGGVLTSTGTAADSSVKLAPNEGFLVATPEGTVSVHPTSTSGLSSTVTVKNGSAGVSTNTAAGVDSILRPTYSGLTDFNAIREPASPETYSWEVNLQSGQTLESVDAQHAAVYFEDGHQMMFITAERAHGADGKEIQTSLAVTGPHTVTLTVRHHVTGVVYPVLTGAGFEVGYSTVLVIPPPPPTPVEPEPEGTSIQLSVGPPEASPTNQPGEEASASFFGYRAIKKWHAMICPDDYLPLIDECESWYQHIKGFFYYDGHEAWYPDNRQPVCEHDTAPLFSVNEINCNWVGPNHQLYLRDGAGYHISAQTRVYAGFSYIVAEKQGYHAATFRAFGSGNIYGHPNDNICNPIRPGC